MGDISVPHLHRRASYLSGSTTIDYLVSLLMRYIDVKIFLDTRER